MFYFTKSRKLCFAYFSVFLTNPPELVGDISKVAPDNHVVLVELLDALLKTDQSLTILREKSQETLIPEQKRK